jgi:hypothetical protein
MTVLPDGRHRRAHWLGHRRSFRIGGLRSSSS